MTNSTTKVLLRLAPNTQTKPNQIGPAKLGFYRKNRKRATRRGEKKGEVELIHRPDGHRRSPGASAMAAGLRGPRGTRVPRGGGRLRWTATSGLGFGWGNRTGGEDEERGRCVSEAFSLRERRNGMGELHERGSFCSLPLSMGFALLRVALRWPPSNWES